MRIRAFWGLFFVSIGLIVLGLLGYTMPVVAREEVTTVAGRTTLINGRNLPQTTACASPLCLDWSSKESLRALATAWGDVDNDGDLDLLIGSTPDYSYACACYEGHLRLYQNEAGTLSPSAIWSDAGLFSADSVAWGDVDGDGDLDLAVGNGSGGHASSYTYPDAPLQLYHNDRGTLTASAVWTATERSDFWSVVWGDVDNDGDLDLAAAGYGQPNRIYRNNNGVLTTSPVWTATQVYSTTSLAWGDMNGDGYLDLAVGNENNANLVYLNTSGTLSTTATWTATEVAETNSLVWGDYDNDGDIDLAVGNFGFFDPMDANAVYRNDGGLLTTSAVWTAAETDDYTLSINWGDFDRDGYLDLAVGNYAARGGPGVRVYRYNSTSGVFDLNWSSAETDEVADLTWGDVNNDGMLDLAVATSGYSLARLYRNTRVALPTSGAQITELNPGYDNASGIAWGDVDRDGDLDLAVSARDYPTIVLPNVGGTLGATPVFTSADSGNSYGLAWGDINGDGDLDLAVADHDGPIKLYENINGNLQSVAAWTSGDTAWNIALAWNDYDNDGDLDLAVGRDQFPTVVYANQGLTLTSTPVWSSVETGYARAVAWGDVDNDGDADLAVASGSFSYLYRNEVGALLPQAIWQTLGNGYVSGAAWGDYDGDGDLDLALSGRPNLLYRNNSGMLTTEPVWSSLENFYGYSPTWSDYDNDGDLDLAIGGDEQGALYRNENGVLADTAVWRSDDFAQSIKFIAWGDVDNDGDLDLAGIEKNFGRVLLYTNGRALNTPAIVPARPGANADFNSLAQVRSGLIALPYKLRDLRQWPVRRLFASYSPNGGGQWFPVIAAGGTLSANLSTSPNGTPYTYTWDVNRSGFFGQADNLAIRFEIFPAFYANRGYTNSIPAQFQTGKYYAQTFPFRVRGTQIRVMRGAVPAGDAVVYRLPQGQLNGALPFADDRGQAYRTTAFGGYLQGRGQMAPGDGLVALQPITTQVVPVVSQQLSGDTPKPLADQNATISTLTFPSAGVIQDINVVALRGTHTYIGDLSFILEGPDGTQVTLLNPSCSSEDDFDLNFDDEAAPASLPCPPTEGGAYQPASPLSVFDGKDSAGVWKLHVIDHALQDTGVLTSWGLAIATGANGYVIYYTSATPNTTGLSMTTASTGGVQTLTVSSARPLVLFNLNVSLEWDARNAPAYLDKLKFDLSRVSEFLYDWTNGQMALGTVTVYQDREQWNTAQVRIYGTNGLHPNADLGGVVANSLTETVVSNLGVTSTITYRPGQVRMAAVWSRFGGGGSTGEDWPRTLAHELAHYLLFQEDAYIGINAQGQFFPLAKCAHTAMTDPYREDYSEFKLPAEWSPDCDDTLGARTTGRSEWETLLRFYPALSATANTGPAALPLGVTRISYADPGAPSTTFAVPVFYMTANGGRYVASNTAKAILYQPTQGRLLDVGRPVDDRITAYGARPGDRLCVYDAQALKTGCEIVSAGDTQLTLVDVPSNWQPDIIATPINSRTVELSVGNAPPGVVLQAQLYPSNGPASAVLTLTERSAGVYSTTTQLANPALAAHVVVWVNEPEPHREAISSYSIGGNPVSPPKKKPSKAPVNSNDGEVTLYTIATFPDGEFYALQRATYVPPIPSWLTLVGPGYRILKSSGAPSLSQSAIGFNYDEGAVPPGEENFLQVYYYQSNVWVPLTTTLDTDRNAALAPTQAAGLYVLVSSFQVRLPAAGWNLFAYPVQATRPVTEALLSIAGQYTTVYGYVVTDTVNPWRLYDVQAASKGYVNDLLNLEYGNGYWINVSAAAVLKFKGENGSAAPLAPDTNPPFALPPATLYGIVPARDGFVPMAGVTLTAFINGVACGQAVTLDYGGQIVYVLHVFAEGLGTEGCGASGRVVTVKAGATTLGTVTWSVGTVQEVTLAPANLQLFLPLIQR